MIIVEADFVPVRGFGDLPVPFPPNKSAAQFGWLYSLGSILYGVSENIYPHGHGNTTVAYVATPSAANALLDFFEREMQRADKGNYALGTRILVFFLDGNGEFTIIFLYTNMASMAVCPIRNTPQQKFGPGIKQIFCGRNLHLCLYTHAAVGFGTNFFAVEGGFAALSDWLP